MNVEVEFEWHLDCGAKLIVEADAYFDGEDSAFPTLAFITPKAGEGRVKGILFGVVDEYSKIEEHAIILICEKGRELKREAS